MVMKIVFNLLTIMQELTRLLVLIQHQETKDLTLEGTDQQVKIA